MKSKRRTPSGSDRPIAVYGAIGGNLSIAVAKFIAGIATGSSAMLSEAFHSVVDTGNQCLLLLGEHRSKKQPDEKHPFGYGKELYFWSLVVAMLLFGIGGGISIYEGVHRIQNPAELKNPTWNYAVLGFAFVAEGISWTIALRELLSERHFGESILQTFQNSKDPAIFVVVGEDTAALLGLIVAAVGVFLSHLLHAPWIDGGAAIVIGLILISVALILIRESRALVMGERADHTVVSGVLDIIAAEPAVKRTSPIFTMQLSPNDILMSFDVEPTLDRSLSEGMDAVARIENNIKDRFKVHNLTIGLRRRAALSSTK